MDPIEAILGGFCLLLLFCLSVAIRRARWLARELQKTETALEERLRDYVGLHESYNSQLAYIRELEEGKTGVKVLKRGLLQVAHDLNAHQRWEDELDSTDRLPRVQ